MNYRNHALILGCSFSNGSYTFDADFIKPDLVLQPDGSTKLVDTGLGREHLDVNGSWIEQLSTKDHYTLYTTGGVGVAQYSTVIEYYYEKNQLQDFDYVLIQNTWEPRLVWHEPRPFTECYWLQENLDASNIIMYEGKDTSKHFNFMSSAGRSNLGGHFHNAEEWQVDMFQGETNKAVIHSCATYIDEICRLCNKKLFYFHWANTSKGPHVLEYEHGQKLNVPYPWGAGKGTFDLFMKPKYHAYGYIDPSVSRDGKDLFIGHFTKEGNRVVGKRISKELEKYL